MEMVGLNKLSLNIFKGNEKKGFHNDKFIMSKIEMNEMLKPQEIELLKNHSKVAKIALVISELSESIEALRKRKVANLYRFEAQLKLGGDFKVLFETFIKDTFEDEIADSLIRLYDIVGNEEMDIETHIKYKLLYNELREPMHGKEF